MIFWDGLAFDGVADEAEDGEGIGIHRVIGVAMGPGDEFHIGGSPGVIGGAALFGDEEAVGIFGSDGGEDIKDIFDAGITVEDGDAPGFGGGDLDADNGDPVFELFGVVFGVGFVIDVVGIAAESDADADAGIKDPFEVFVHIIGNAARVAFVVAGGVWTVEPIGIPEDKGLSVNDF